MLGIRFTWYNSIGFPLKLSESYHWNKLIPRNQTCSDKNSAQMSNVNRLSKNRKSKACYNTNGPWIHTQYKEPNVKGCILHYVLPIVCWDEKLRTGKTQRDGKGVAGEGAENDAYEHRVSFWGEGNILELDSAAGMKHCELSKTTTYSLCMHVVSMCHSYMWLEEVRGGSQFSPSPTHVPRVKAQIIRLSGWATSSAKKPHSKCWMLEELCIHFLSNEKNGIPP